MDTDSIISAIDTDIVRLKQARDIIAGLANDDSGQPITATRPKRTMSAAARKKIAEAQRKRWAAIKRAARQS